jgi:DNA-binding response OmpR family regulator
VRVLIVEDEAKLAAIIRRGLRAAGHAADVAAGGRDALWMAGATEYSAIVLDLMLPDVDGFDVCRRLRADAVRTPILMLTARDAVADRVAGLDAGADDYLIKPFRLSELLARIRAHLRRTAAAAPVEHDSELRARDVVVDRAARRAWRAGSPLEQRPKEFELLALLVAESGRAVTRERIMHDVWDTEWLGSTKTLDTHMVTLRAKLGADAITTLRGVGYRFEPDEPPR